MSVLWTWVSQSFDRVLAVLAGAVGTVVFESLTGGVSRLARSARIAFRNRSTPAIDLQSLGLFVAGEWSPSRVLTADRLHQEMVVTEATDPLVGSDDWAWAKQRAAHDAGELVHLAGFTIDHRESERTQRCHVRLAASDYSDVRAIEALRIERPMSLAAADDLLRSGMRNYLRRAVPSSIAVNVVVLSENDELLCLRRSSAVDNGVGMWTVGIYETMKRSDPNNPGSQEDFFRLVTRAINEELGLIEGTEAYTSPRLAWLGVYRPLLRGHLVAVTRLRITKERLEDSMRSANSNYEHDSSCWLPLDRGVVRAFSAAEVESASDEAGSIVRFERGPKRLRGRTPSMLYGKHWIDQSPLSVVEAWKFAAALPD